ncbi:MAG: hypothetical protein GHCLOJNM_00720 [bacterium]|nr:hypothetical protein [bacterium]
MSLKEECANLAVILFAVFFIGVVVRTAWLSDSAFVDLRIADNLAHGFGFRWNMDERVLVTDHPLWTLILAGFYFFTEEPYYTTILLSVGLSFAAILVFALGIASSEPAAIVGISILALSKAFVDYSTSGLETALLHFLLVGFLMVWLNHEQRRWYLFLLALMFSLVLLTRVEAGVLILPLLAAAGWKRRTPSTILALLAGFVPFLCWEVFSLLYFGFPRATPSYAVSRSGVSAGIWVIQGIHYHLNSINLDPLTLSVIVSVLVVTCLVRDRFSLLMALGTGLYLAGTLLCGGDRMSGHLFSAPLFCAVAILSRWDASLLKTWLPVWGLILAVGFHTEDCPVLSGPNYGRTEVRLDNLIANEREVFYPWTGLSRVQREQNNFGHSWAIRGEMLRNSGDRATLVESNVGMLGYFGGPGVYLLHPCGLADPLLARMPGKHPTDILGERRLPKGYLKSLETGTNCIHEQHLSKYYDKIVLLTRGDLGSKDRLKTLIALNMGVYDHLLDGYLSEPVYSVTNASFGTPAEEGDPWDAPDNLIIESSTVGFDFGTLQHSPMFEISLDHNDRYRLTFQLDSVPQGELLLETDRRTTPGLTVYRAALPSEVVSRGYDSFILEPVSGDGFYSMGHFRLLE